MVSRQSGGSEGWGERTTRDWCPWACIIPQFARRAWEDREGISVDRGLLGDTSSSKLQAPHLARVTDLDPIKGLKPGN